MKIFTKQFHDKCSKTHMERFSEHTMEAKLLILEDGEKNLVAEHRGRAIIDHEEGITKAYASPILFHDNNFWMRSNEYGHVLDMDRPKDKSAKKCYTEREAFAYWIKLIEEAESKWNASEIMLLWAKPFFYVVTGEPRYYINTFGFNNGTSIFIDCCYNPNISPERYFNVKDLEKAKVLAKKIAKKRGDKGSVGPHEKIKIIDPNVFTANPMKEHTNVDSFSRSLSGITESGIGPIGGLLAMGMALKRDK
jgi:hypothetical protein